jgi:hypothetical protein
VRFSTILSWTPYKNPVRYGGDQFWGKERELEKVISLPQITGASFELAVSGRTPEGRLRAHGWDIRPAVPISNTPAAYQDYIAASAAEFSVAKDVYVTTRSGWFSERTACYLASGRPAVVQNTSFGGHMPTGAGILAYDDLEGAADGVRRVVADYAFHSAAARRIAEQHFNPKRVLTDLLASVGAR